MQTAYIQGTRIVGASGNPEQDWRAMLDAKPLPAAVARRAIAQGVRQMVNDASKKPLLADLAAIDQSIARHNVDPIPDGAANVLREAVKRASPPTTVVGMIDVQAQQRAMNGLKSVTVGMAQILLARGQEVIKKAMATAKARGLPGDTKRDEVFWKLQWHENTLRTLAPSALQAYFEFQSDPNAFKKAGAAFAALYPSGTDLKKWVMQAFIEGNAVEEGAAYLDQAWRDMWREIGAAIAALPAELAKKVAAAAEDIAWYAKVSFWVILGSVALVGYGGYKLLSSKTGHRITRHYLGVR